MQRHACDANGKMSRFVFTDSAPTGDKCYLLEAWIYLQIDGRKKRAILVARKEAIFYGNALL